MLRDYQKEIVAASVLSRDDNTLIQADTGAGKTRILSAIAQKHSHVLIVAHRNALVAQLSLEFAKAGLAHRMIAAKTTARRAELLHRRKLGKSHLKSRANRIICSIDTLMSKSKRDELSIDIGKKWLIIVDEAHHMIEENKWGKLCDIFKRSRVVGATATPLRLDGIPLKKGRGGVFDSMVQSESLKQDSVTKLIKRGFISAFKCYAVESDISARSYAGDVIQHYKRLANNKQAVMFCISIEDAKKTAIQFKKSGIASAAIHSKMSSTEVDRIFDLFESKQIQVLCNVDMMGEGVDIPAIEALIMRRKTASLTLYRQWVGRTLRPCSGKEYSIIIDHSGNVLEHGLPDQHINWSLDRPPTPAKSNLIPCDCCGFLVKAWIEKCPECGEILRSEKGFSEKELRYIDAKLVEIYRTRQAQESRDNALASTVDSKEIRYLNQYGSKSANMTTKVALWFFENIKEHITRKQAEDFFFKNNNMNFWSTHFKLSDLNSKNKKKCLRVYNEYKIN